jgi:hypothetical protein
MPELCAECGHPMSAHETIDHWWSNLRNRVEPPPESVRHLPRFTTVCTQGRPADVDASPWDHVCGCVWSFNAPPLSALHEEEA